MIWLAVAAALVMWLAGVLLRLGQWVSLLLVVAGALLVLQVIAERRSPSD